MRANRLSDEEIREIIDQIICGDALEVLPRLPAHSVDLVLTDPPYFLDKLDNESVKPLALCEYLIQLTVPEGAVVLDPFLGSGTTALAARNLMRRYIGIEINPEYVAIACKRLQNRTPSLFE